MKTFLQKLFVFVLLIGFMQACNEPLVEEQVMDDVELKSAQNGKISYIVVLNDAELNAELSNLKGYEKRQQAAQKAAEKVMKRAGITDGELDFVYGTAIKGFSVKIPPGQLKKLQDDPAVKYVEEDQVISLAPPLNISTVSATSTQSTPWGITRVKGGGDNLPAVSPKAWIVDSGIDLNHPDLNVNVSLSKSFVEGDTSPDDANGHGTHVAGTVAAINNDFGVIGVAPNTEVVSCRVLGSDGTGSFSWTIAALDYIAITASPGDVVNMSLGPQSRYTDQAVDDAVTGTAEAGIKIAIAAGNSSDDATYYSPARVNHPNVYTVAAMAEGDIWASYSNFGSPVDYIEPGSYVTSTYIDGYAQMSGTSMASPHMAGILLLGNFETDGSVSVRKRGTVYSYDIAVVGSGSLNTPPSASFTYYATDLTVDFTDTSTDSDGTIQSRSWNFGDGGTSTTQNQSHTYATPGTYTVTLTVTDDDGAIASTSQNVTVTDGGTTNNPPSAGFSFTTNDLTTTFTDQSSDADGSVVGWNWNFGDGGTSTAQNTSHTYAASGTYTVTLTVTDDDGATETVSKSVTVTTSQTSDITLFATLRKVRGVRYVDLTWSGAEGTNISIKVNGSVLTNTTNDGEHTLDMARSSGTFTFQICETEGSACSNEVTLAL